MPFYTSLLQVYIKSKDDLNGSYLKRDYFMNYRFKYVKLYIWPTRKMKLKMASKAATTHSH